MAAGVDDVRLEHITVPICRCAIDAWWLYGISQNGC